MSLPESLLTGDRPALRREVLRLALPVVLQNLLYTAMFYVDTYMIQRVGESAMAAMGIVGPVAHTIGSILLALSVGTVATVSRAWGEGNRARQEEAASSAVGLALLLGVPLSAAGFFLLPRMAGLFALPDAPEATAMAEGFLRFEGLSLFFVCLDAAASGTLRAAGRTVVPMVNAIAANGLNVLLNWVFIYGNLGAPAMGVAGAGLATACALALQASLSFGFLWTSRSPIRLRASAVTGASMRRLLGVALPAAAEPMLLQAGFLIYTKAITLLGVTAMAAHRAAITVESLTFMPGHGFATAGSAVVGQCLGAGRPDRADLGFRETARISVYLMSAVGLAFLLFPMAFVRLFLQSPELEPVAYMAAVCLAVSALEQPLMALGMAYAGALRGAGDTRSPVIVGLIGIWGVRVPLAWALAFPAGLGLTGIWITMGVDWGVRVALFAYLWGRGRWRTIKL